MNLETIKVVSPVSDDNTLGYIVINATDRTDKHELFDESAELKIPGSLTVVQIKEALAAKNVTIPDGVTKKADLQALLDTQDA